MEQEKNKKIKKQVVYAEYNCYSVFKVPKGLDLEDTSIVESWWVKWDRLHIKYVDKEEIEIIDSEETGNDLKHPNEETIHDAEELGYEFLFTDDEEEEENVVCLK